MERGENCLYAGIADRPWWKPFSRIGVVGGVLLEIAFGQVLTVEVVEERRIDIEKPAAIGTFPYNS